MSGEIELISSPKEFFDSNPQDLEEVIKVVRSGFGRNLDFQDIYAHVTSPKEVYLLRNGSIKAMASYNKIVLGGLKSLIIEGVALVPEIQGKGIFEVITQQALGSEELACLRTQNPRMYRALEKLCKVTYPNSKTIPENMKPLFRDFASYLKCEIDDACTVKGYYGGLFYGKEPKHCRVTKLFKEDLKMDLAKGDAVLAIGIR